MNLTIAIPDIPNWFRQKNKKGFDNSVFGQVHSFTTEQEENLYWLWVSYFIKQIEEIQNDREPVYFIEPD